MMLWKSVGESREDSVCSLRELVTALFLNVLSGTLTGPPQGQTKKRNEERQTETNEKEQTQGRKVKSQREEEEELKKETSLNRNKARTSVRIRFGSPFSSKVKSLHCLMTLCLTIHETLKWLSSLPILMQESYWW